jgi:hypothetical protein
MTDLLPAIAHAINLASRLRTIADRIRDAEFKGILADLSIELADMKLKVADLMSENAGLRAKLQEHLAPAGPPCPRCHKRGWQVVSSKPDTMFGELGGIRRTYKCPSCEFTEEQLETPK